MTTKQQVGDRVLFYPPVGLTEKAKPPIGAEIVHVWSDSCVNLKGDDGVTRSSVYFRPPESTALFPRGYYCEPAPAKATEPSGFDLAAHLRRQAEFSHRTFGPGPRVQGVCDHIRKELIEVQTAAALGGATLPEWVDVIILAFDGAWRSGATPAEIIDAIVAKQSKNEGRTWPDWRTADPGKAIEHDRSAEAAEGGAL